MQTSESPDAAKIQCPTCSVEVLRDFLIPAGDSKVCPNCRDEYLQRLKEGVTAQSADGYDLIRHDHIKHEASLKSVGVLYLLGGVLAIVGGVGLAFGMMNPSGAEASGFYLAFFLIYAVLGVLFIVVGRGFRKLRPWVRIPGTIFSCLGLLSIPIGTLINGYILYLIWSKKGKMVFSPEYKEIMEATPEIKYKKPTWIWVLLGLVVAFLVFGLVVAGSR